VVAGTRFKISPISPLATEKQYWEIDRSFLSLFPESFPSQNVLGAIDPNINYVFFDGQKDTAAIFVKEDVLEAHQNDWKTPIWARLPRVKSTVDFTDIQTALDPEYLDLGRWFSSLGKSLFAESRCGLSLSVLN
jgi:hypothetical protein